MFTSVHEIVWKNKQNSLLLHGFIVLFIVWFFFCCCCVLVLAVGWVFSLFGFFPFLWNTACNQPNVRNYLSPASSCLFPHVYWCTLQCKRGTWAIGKHAKTGDVHS